MKPKTKYFMSKIMAMNKKIYSILAIILVFTLLLPQSAFAYSPTYGQNGNTTSSNRPLYIIKNTDVSEETWNKMKKAKANDPDWVYQSGNSTLLDAPQIHGTMDYVIVELGEDGNNTSFISEWSSKSKTTADDHSIHTSSGYIATCQNQNNELIIRNDIGAGWYAACTNVSTNGKTTTWTWEVDCYFNYGDYHYQNGDLQMCGFTIQYSYTEPSKPAKYSRTIQKNYNINNTLAKAFPNIYGSSNYDYSFKGARYAILKGNASGIIGPGGRTAVINYIINRYDSTYLAGIFTLDKNGKVSSISSFGKYTVINNNGTLYLSNIDENEKFYLIEISTPDSGAYEINTDIEGPITVNGNSYGTWASNIGYSYSEQGEIHNNFMDVLSESPSTTSISIEKILQSTGQTIAISDLNGATFKLFYSQTEEPSINISNITVTNGIESRTATRVSGSSTKQVATFIYRNNKLSVESVNNISYSSTGYTPSSDDYGRLWDLPFGYYTLVETKAPSNGKFLLSSNERYDIHLTPESTSQRYTFTVEEPEKLYKSHSVIKNGTGIDDIEYVIVELQDTDGNTITENYIGNTISNPIKLTKDGAFTINGDELSETAWSYEWTHLKDNLEYKVVETAVKPINSEETTEISKIYITDSVTENNITTITNDNGSVSLGIKKEKNDPSINVGSIEGAEYTLLYNSNRNPSISNRTRSKNSDGSWILNYTLESNTTEVATFVIGNDGIGKIKGTNNTTYNGLPGKYMFVETKVPKNYTFDTNIETIYTLNNSDSLTNNDLVSKEPVYFEPLQLSLEKISDSSKPMTGAEFTVQFYEGAQTLDDIKNKNPNKTLIYIINSDNKINFRTDNPTSGIMYDDNEFPIGLGVITETKAPTGYDISTSWTYDDVNYYISNLGVVFSVRENSTNTDADSYLWNGSNWILSDTIDSNLDVEEPTETGKFYFTKYLDGTAKILPNTEFKLYFSTNEPSLSNYSSLTSKTITTDSNGNYQSDNLETGWYILEEIRCDANKGMNLVSPIKFEIKKGDNINLNQKVDIINYQPIISTQEWDGELSTSDYKTHMSNPDNDVKIVDRVTYSNLEPNKVYTVKAIIMDITGGTARWLRTSDKKLIQAQKSFTANSDYVDVNFASFSTEEMYIGTSTKLTTVEGRKFVIYEFLFEGNQEGVLLTTTTVNNLLNNTGNVANAVRTVDGYVKHADIGDIKQIGYFPEIHTLESDTKTLNHVSVLNLDADNKEWITVKDVLTYSGLDTNLTYTIKVQVKEKSTDTVIAEDTSHSFKPTNSSGTYTINDLTFEAIYGPDNTPVNEFYITEELYVGAISDNKLAAVHTLPIDDQSGKVARIKTIVNTNVNTGERDNGILLAYASTNVTINDTLRYSNLNNETYTIECVYKYVGGDKDGQVVKDATGNELRLRRENIQLSDGSINMRLIRKDLSNLEGETIMAYETIYWTNSNSQTIIVAQEANFDASQTVRFIGIPESPNFKVVKMDQFGNYIAGATLEIRDVNGNIVGEPIISKTTATEVSLDPGKYTLVETKSPANYALNESVSFEVKDDNKLYINDEVVDTAMITMIDYNLTALPTAGGIGTIWFIISGLILMLCAVFLKKKYV